MTLAAVKAAIKTEMIKATGVEKVELRLRVKREKADLFALFTRADGKVTGWMLTRRRTAETVGDVSYDVRLHRIYMIGFYVFNDTDDTETAFDLIIDNICTELRGDDLLGGVCELAGPVQVERVEMRRISGVLCNYAELYVDVEEEEAR